MNAIGHNQSTEEFEGVTKLFSMVYPVAVAMEGGGAQSNFTSNKLSEEGYYISAFFLLFIGMFGMFNNLVVIIVMAKNKQLRSPLNMFLLNLAISDFGISIVGNPMSLVAALNRGWDFGQRVCVGYGFLMSFFGISSISTLTVLSFERYLMISRPWKSSELTHRGSYFIIGAIWAYAFFTTAPPLAGWGGFDIEGPGIRSSSELTHRGSYFIIGAIWAYAFFTTAPPLAGWGGFDIEGPGISCSVDWETGTQENVSYIVFLLCFGLGVPMSIMAFSYTNIILTLNQHGQTGLQAGVARAEKRVAVMILIMGTTFLMAWTPYSILAMLMAFGNPDLVTPGAAVVPAIFAKSSCMYNPIIYVGLNTQFRSAWSRLLCCKGDEVTQGQGLVTEKVSLTIFTEHSPQPESIKLKILNRVRTNTLDSEAYTSDLTPVKILQLNPVKVQQQVQVSTSDRGEVRSEIV
ncbi:parapinopsin-like [Homarus americanus]|uniref:parapinopsin-like n=1 Tax=Homarus americanus TaxID=6706 RepID=UPI001C46EDAA|nr:parapinopsin-like [Homarus americanus]